MKIRYADSNGTPQFIVEAEDFNDGEIISMFNHFHDSYRKDFEFCIHGICYTNGKPYAFNFGYRKKNIKKWWRFLEMKVIKLNRSKRTGYKGKSDPYYQSKAWKLLKGAAQSQLSTLCPMCKAEGVTKEGDVWDHDKQRKLGGKDELSNLRKLCNHHDAVNRAIQSKASRVI